MKIITCTSLAPPLLQVYNTNLLSNSPWGMKPPCVYIKRYEPKILKLYKPGTRKHKEYKQIIELYKEFHGWKTALEAYEKTENKKLIEKPLVPIKAIHGLRHLLGYQFRNVFKDCQFYDPKLFHDAHALR